MKAVLTGIVVAVIIAVIAAYVLESQYQQSAEAAFVTSGVRL